MNRGRRTVCTALGLIAALAAMGAEPAAPLRLTQAEAVLAGLGNNRALKVERRNPDLLRTYADEQRAAFDPVLAGQVSYQDSLTEQLSRMSSGTTNNESTAVAGRLGLAGYLPTGTRLALEGTTSLLDSSLYRAPFDSTRLGLSVTQPLLQGGRPSVVLATLRQARLDVLRSRYELRGYAENLVARIEAAYWVLSLAAMQTAVLEDSLRLAERQLEDTRARIRAGDLAEVEAAAATAEVASRREGLVAARGASERARLALLGLMQLPDGGWDRPIETSDPPSAPPDDPATPERHVATALNRRADLNQARLLRDRGDLEIVRTRNGLLPKLDLFATFGRTGYADSFGQSVRDVPEDGHDAMIGLQFEVPLGNRAAEARHERAKASLDQAVEALANMERLAEMDVRGACVDIERNRAEIEAAAATLAAREEALRAETGKFRAGKSTTLLVARAQRDVLESRLAVNRAAVARILAGTELYRLEGTLLARRGLAIEEAGEANGDPAP